MAYLLALLGVKGARVAFTALSAGRQDPHVRDDPADDPQGSRPAMVLAIEDLHWIDKTSQDLLVVLAEALAGRRSCPTFTARAIVPLDQRSNAASSPSAAPVARQPAVVHPTWARAPRSPNSRPSSPRV
jgi:hypothetical protein